MRTPFRFIECHIPSVVLMAGIMLGAALIAYSKSESTRLKAMVEDQQNVWGRGLDLRVRIYALGPSKMIDPTPITSGALRAAADVVVELRRPNADSLISDLLAQMAELDFESAEPRVIGLVVSVDGPWEKNELEVAISKDRTVLIYGGCQAKIPKNMSESVIAELYQRALGALGDK